MCLAIYKPKGVEITKKALKRGFENNEDGGGFAIAHEGKIQVFKGYFKFGEFYKAFKPYQAHEAIIHFRLATHGKTNAENCHPFTVLNEQFAVIHNGILNIDCNKNKDLSDTWHFAELVLSPLLENNTFDAPYVRYLIETSIGDSNKVVILRADGCHAIFNEKAGHWHKGAWYSNDSYKHENRWTWGGWQSEGKTHAPSYAKSHKRCKTSREYWDKMQLPAYYRDAYPENQDSFPDYEGSKYGYEADEIDDEQLEILNGQYETWLKNGGAPIK